MTAEPPPHHAGPAPPVIEAKPPAPTARAEPSAANVRADADALTLAEMWMRVMTAVESMPSISVAAEPMRPVERRGSTLRLSAPERSAKMFTEFQRSKLEQEIERVFGSPLRVELVTETAGDPAPADRTDREVDASARARAMEHPVVKKAAELFDARIIRVDPAE